MKSFIMDFHIDKIYQPTKNELIFYLKKPPKNFSSSKNSTLRNYKLLLNISSNYSRLGFIDQNIENPVQPSMFCMSLRKHLTNAKLINISQQGFDRIVFFDFETFNEVKDKVFVRLIIEIMGRHSNIILVSKDDLILDCLKKVNDNMSAKRQLLPKLKYKLPPTEKKFNLLTDELNFILNRLLFFQDLTLKKSLIKSIEGLSPLLADEILFNSKIDLNILVKDVSDKMKNDLAASLSFFKDILIRKDVRPVLFLDKYKNPTYFSFIDLNHLSHQKSLNSDNSALVDSVVETNSFNKLIEIFYQEKGNADRTYQVTKNISHLLNNILNKLSNKLSMHKQEKINCQEKEKIQQCAILLQSNLHKIKKNSNFIVLENFFDSNKKMKIDLDVRLSGPQNAQKYFNKYKKMCVADKMLDQLIVDTQNEITYIESVLFNLMQIKNYDDLTQIQLELQEQGYLKIKKIKENHKHKTNKLNNKQTQVGFRKNQLSKIKSTDGFEILVGNNNINNDWLTFRYADKNDVWLHAQKIPGAHVVIITNGKDIPESTLKQAAELAVQNSKAKCNTSVDVDFTFIKHVKKFKGAKPGMVIYNNYKTITVKPMVSI